MPYKDPEAKKEYMRQWRKEAIASGYGKVLYGRRRVRFENEKRYRRSIEEAIRLLKEGDSMLAKKQLESTLRLADKAVLAQEQAEQEARK